MDGYNACIIAYGQTGSGKTYTMMGTPEDRGVNWRALEELLARCQQDENVVFSLDIAMMEVYNEHVYDLLVPFREEPINVHVRPNGSINMEELHRLPVKNMGEVKVGHFFLSSFFVCFLPHLSSLFRSLARFSERF
jgi:kinesin family protein C2/C3